jgi:DNA-directed RNA polymerase subunit M/transcription elongation factor TFIIS
MDSDAFSTEEIFSDPANFFKGGESEPSKGFEFKRPATARGTKVSFAKKNANRDKTDRSAQKAENNAILPPLRWKCQRLLQCCAGESRFCPMLETDNAVAYARQLEEVIFVHSLGQKDRYASKCKQLAFALKQNGSFLVQRYEPCQLVALDDALLAEGTPQEKKRKEFEVRVDACRKLMSNTDIFDDMNISTAIAKCSWCKGTNISFNPLQTRSADEGMNIYCLCQTPGCGNSWTFRG